jgi:acylphosphatase
MAERAIAVRVSGRVQGVAYRAWTQGLARRTGVRGWVRNLSDGSVGALLIGPEDRVEEMVQAMRRGPPDARVEDLAASAAEDDGSLGFAIRR